MWSDSTARRLANVVGYLVHMCNRGNLPPNRHAIRCDCGSIVLSVQGVEPLHCVRL